MKSLKDIVERYTQRLLVPALVVFAFAAQAASFSRSHGFSAAASLLAGYWLGMLGGFAWFLGRSIYEGKGGSFVDNHPIFKWFSYLGIVLILCMGGLAAFAKHSASVANMAKYGLAIGGFVMTCCVVPFIKRTEAALAEKRITR